MIRDVQHIAYSTSIALQNTASSSRIA